MSRKTRFLLPVAGAIAGLFLTACGQHTSAPMMGGKGPVEVGVTTLHTAPVTLTSELSGRTVASMSADVRPQVAGLIKARRFEEGAMVRAGQVLYEIDAAAYRAALDQAKASLSTAQAAISAAQLKSERYANLLKIEGVSKQDADDANVAYRQAVAAVELQRAAVKSAQINLDYTQVRAPISGRIGKSSVTPGALVTAAQTTALATIRALDPIFVDVTQSSEALLRLRRDLAGGHLQKAGAEVSLKLEDGSTYPRKGLMKFSEIAVDEATGSVTLRAEFPNPEGTLLPGMYVRAAMDDAVNPQGLLVPQTAVTRNPKGEATVLVVDADKHAQTKIVQADRAIGDQWLVSSGVASGDSVIVQGSNKIRPGSTLTTVEVPATPVAKGN